MRPVLSPGCCGSVLPLRGNEFVLKPISLIFQMNVLISLYLICNLTIKKNAFYLQSFAQVAISIKLLNATQHYLLRYSCCVYNSSRPIEASLNM